LMRREVDARRQQAVARIAQAEADLDGATVALGYARITAPTDAIVVARTVEVGNLAAPGTPLLTVEEERYRLEATVPESDVARLRVGQPATVAVDALGRTLAGAIVEIVPAELEVAGVVRRCGKVGTAGRWSGIST